MSHWCASCNRKIKKEYDLGFLVRYDNGEMVLTSFCSKECYEKFQRKLKEKNAERLASVSVDAIENAEEHLLE